MSEITCELAVRRAYDQLAGLIPVEERVAFGEHFASCDRCSDLMAQLRGTIAVLRSRRDLEVPDVTRELAAEGDDARGSELVGHLPQLYSLAVALDPVVADDLVPETISRALADPTSDTSDAGLAATLTERAAVRGALDQYTRS